MLFLRPTESATVFLQQLGRGLRLADDKPCLTVLDFIGAQHQVPLRPALPRADRELTPRGSQRDVEQASRPCRPAATSSWTGSPADRAGQHQAVAARVDGRGSSPSCAARRRPTWPTFLEKTGLELEDVYRGNGRQLGWTCGGSPAGTTAPIGPGRRRAGGRASAACCTSTTSSGSRCFQAGRPLRRAVAVTSGHVGLRPCCTSPSAAPRTPFSSVEDSLARLLANRGRAEELRAAQRRAARPHPPGRTGPGVAGRTSAARPRALQPQRGAGGVRHDEPDGRAARE